MEGIDIEGLDADEAAEFMQATYEEEGRLTEENALFFDALEHEEQALHDGWFDAHAPEFEQEIAAQEQAMHQNNIEVDEMVDAIVGNSTRRSYLDDNLKFFKWCSANKPDWMTAYGSAQLTHLEQEAEGMRTRARREHVRVGLKELLRDAALNPIVDTEAITASGFMEYIEQCRNGRTGRRLSKSAYGNRRSALFDLFRWHNPASGGYPEDFKRQLTNLYKGFFRILTQDGGRRDDGDDEGRRVKEGKDPMSVLLYQKLCVWFLEMKTLDGVFAYC